MTTAPRININAAARRIASQHGLKVRCRESWNSRGERLVRWSLQDTSGQVTHELEMTCTDGAPYGSPGWAGGLRLFHRTPHGREDSWSVLLVDVAQKLGRRAATALTHVRLAEWAGEYRAVS